MSKNKKSTAKPEMDKKIETEQKNKNNSHSDENIFNPKNGMQNFINEFNNSFCGTKNNHLGSILKDMMNKLSHNFKHNFEDNMELSQEILKCKTASDFIEFQRKNFEINYKHFVKTYSELLHDITKAR